MKLEKNYYRNHLKQLIEDTKGRPIIVSAKYKYTNDPKWETFTTIRPFIPNVKTATLCDHIDIERNHIRPWYDLQEEHNRKFYIIGYPFIYLHYGAERGGLRLADDLGIPPIIHNQDFCQVKNTVVEQCYKFSVSKYKRGIY